MMIDRRRLLTAGGACATLSLSGCGPAFFADEPEEATVVEMGATSFMPETVEIDAGESVEWRNTSIAPHTVTTVAEQAENPGRVRLPEGAEPFDSGTIEPGGIFRLRFDVPGEYVYFCEPHEAEGMWGTVIVRG